MTFNSIVSLINAGFIAKNDCNGTEFYSHSAGIVVRATDKPWVIAMKLNVAKKHNV